MEELFNKFMNLKHDIQNLAGIVQNEGIEVSEEDLTEWNHAVDKFQNKIDMLVDEVNELYKK